MDNIEKASEQIMYEGWDKSGWFLLGTASNEDNPQLFCRHCHAKIPEQEALTVL